MMNLEAELARCDREIAEIAGRPPAECEAYLTVLGRNDWEHEKRLIAAELCAGKETAR